MSLMLLETSEPVHSWGDGTEFSSLIIRYMGLFNSLLEYHTTIYVHINTWKFFVLLGTSLSQARDAKARGSASSPSYGIEYTQRSSYFQNPEGIYSDPVGDYWANGHH